MENLMETETASVEDFLRHIPLFRKCSSYAISKLAVKMRHETYHKGETILLQGVISNQLFMVVGGMVSVSSRKDKVSRFLANLERTSYFGEISLVRSCAATATVKAAVEPTEVYILDHDVIQEVLRESPEAKEDLENIVKERNHLRLQAFQEAKGQSPAVAPTPN